MKEQKLKIKPLHEKFIMPIKGSEASACYDCYATSVVFDSENNVASYGLGFSVEPPKGYRVDIRPRSSIYKTGLVLCNSIATIDNDYRGEILVKFYTANAKIEDIYQVGDRVCQMMLVRDEPTQLVIVDNTTDTKRGDGGFGSTGL